MMIEMMEMLMMMLKNWHPLFASQTPRSSPRRSSASCGSSWGQKIIIRCVAFSHLYKSQELGTSTPGASPPFCFPVASWMLGLPGSPQGSSHPHLRTLSKAQQSRELSAFAEETSSTTRCGKCQINVPKKYPRITRKWPQLCRFHFKWLKKNLLLRIQCCQLYEIIIHQPVTPIQFPTSELLSELLTRPGNDRTQDWPIIMSSI